MGAGLLPFFGCTGGFLQPRASVFRWWVEQVPEADVRPWRERVGARLGRVFRDGSHRGLSGLSA
jgi:hypothetical protein